MNRPWIVRVKTPGKGFGEAALPMATSCREFGLTPSCLRRADHETTIVDWEFPDFHVARQFRKKFGGLILKRRRA